VSSRRAAIVLGLALAAVAARAHAQPAAQGFAFERFYPAPSGAGWLVLDDLNIPSSVGGAIGLALSYEHDPLRISSGGTTLDVVSDKLFADIGGSFTYARWRFYLDFDTPFLITGDSGTVGGYAFTAPSVDPSSHPDPIEDIRVGVDRLVLGNPGDPLRVGGSAQLYIPNDSREDYTTDRDFRGMLRALVAGDIGRFTYAGELGMHIRPLDEAPAPGTPRGSELLFGIAGGARMPLACGTWSAVFGAELYGASAFRSLFESETTAFEGMVSTRLEQLAGEGRRLRIKLGLGVGIVPDFGAPEFRAVVAIDMFGEAR